MSDYDDLFDDGGIPSGGDDADLIARIASNDDTPLSEPTEISPPERPVADDAQAFADAAHAGAITAMEPPVDEPAASKRGRRSRTVSDQNADAAKIRRGRRSSRKNDATPDATGVVAPRTVPLTAFDFLGGEFERARKVRLLSIGLIGAVGVVSLFLIQLGVGAYLGRQSVAEEVDRLRADHGALTSTYNDMTTIGGVSAVELDNHISSRLSELDASVGSELDSVALLREYLSNPIADSEITSISITSGSDSASSDESSDDSESDEAPAASDTPSGPMVTVKMSVTVDTHEALAAWLARIEATSGFKATYPSMNTPTTVEIVGTITAPGSARHTTLTSSITPSTDVSDAARPTGEDN